MSGAVASDGRAWLWGFGTNSQLGKCGNDDGDEIVPKLLVATKALQGKCITSLAFGGQHVVLLAVASVEEPGPIV